MIISASRRTDIPAFYAPWFMNRIREGYVMVPNPFNSKQIKQVGLTPQDVDALVFWTRNPEPLFHGLDELERRGYPYYFLFTITGLGGILEKNVLPTDKAVNVFKRLSKRLDPKRVVWRFDPIIITDVSPPNTIIQTFERLSGLLEGFTEKAVFSFAALYKKVERNLAALKNREGIEFYNISASPDHMLEMAGKLADIASQRGMRLTPCCPQTDYSSLGLDPGGCVDPSVLEELTGLSFPKEKTQRKGCNCARSIDIGQYDSCLHGCVYCYAVHNRSAALVKRKRHNPDSPFMIGTPNDYPGCDHEAQGRLF